MKKTKPRKLKKRFLNSWITSLVNITLVLVLMGLLSFIVINAQQLANHVREQIGFTLVLRDGLKEVEIVRLQKVLVASEYVKTTRFIDKESAASELVKELGEDFEGFLGYNPLFASLDVKLHAPYTITDSLLMLEQKFLNYPQVEEVYYHQNLVILINKNVKKISVILLIISALLTFIFFGLINNTIRLLIYSQRFIINTMQMVGASKNYIRKPFIKRSILLGFTGAVLSNIILFSGIYGYSEKIMGLVTANELINVLTIGTIVFILGITISIISTLLALNKFLRLQFDELFY